MEKKAGAQISKKAFFQSVVILFLLMITAGILTLVIPTGAYNRLLQADREIIDNKKEKHEINLRPNRPNRPIRLTRPSSIKYGDFLEKTSH